MQQLNQGKKIKKTLYILDKESKKFITQLAEIIESKNNFLLTTHIRPDPDGVSSELALFHLLKSIGKNVLLINDSAFPELLNFLLYEKNKVHDNIIKSDRKPTFPSTYSKYILNASEYNAKENICFDVAIILDTPNIDRLGKTHHIIPKETTLINIDHHISNENFADLNWVCPDACSTGEMVYYYLKETHQQITDKIATALYTSILTDTGRFVHSNTTPKSLRIASDLIEHGADPAYIAKQIYQTNTYEILKLQSMAIDKLKLEANGQIAITWLTKNMIKNSNLKENVDTQLLIDIPSSIQNVSVAILLKEMEESNDIKVSLRSKNNVDVNRIAQQFGGGGHLKASGCEIPGTIEEVHRKVVKEVEKELNFV